MGRLSNNAIDILNSLGVNEEKLEYYSEYSPLIDALNKLAHYEDLADDGRLKELPCREGSRVYKVTTQRDNFDDTEYPIIIQASFRLDMLKDFGKTVFLTHEDAETKLAEVKGE